jgi:tetratricopeptide (TPR) repeat protein
VASGVATLPSLNWKKPIYLGVAGVLLVLALLTGQQNLIWRSGETLWLHTISVSPGSVKAYSNLGRIYFTTGRYKEAFACFDQARTIAPADPHYDFFTGLRYFIRGDYAQALPHFSRAEARDQDFIEVLFHTAMAHEALGSRAQAIAYFSRTIQSKQDDLGNFKATAREHLQLLRSRRL